MPENLLVSRVAINFCFTQLYTLKAVSCFLVLQVDGVEWCDCVYSVGKTNVPLMMRTIGVFVL
jgi:hypothetical protein